MEKEYLFKGSVAELMAPMDDNWQLNLDLFKKNIDWQLERGTEAFFLNGLVSESYTATREENMLLTKTAADHLKGKGKIMANISLSNINEGKEMAKQFEQMGVTAICITPPQVFPYESQGIYDYYAEIITSVDLPMYVYNMPQTCNTMSPKLASSLINDFDNVWGYKDSTQDIIHLQTMMAGIKEGKHVECISGSDGTIFPVLTVGGCGVISLIANPFPKPVQDLCKAYFEGDIVKAKEMQFFVLKIRSILKYAPYLAGTKYAMELVGQPSGNVRPPLSEPTEEQKKYIRTELAKLDLI